MELINTCRPDDAATAYSTSLHWLLSVGYRHRPRQGCTCTEQNCPVPGAHPRPDSPVYVGPELIVQELEQSPGAGIIAWTTRFDALVLPRSVGLATMAALDQIAQVPCIVTDDAVTLLVLPATGRFARTFHPDLEVRSGRSNWIALPPSHGTRWDTPPWVPQTSTPVALLHGVDVGCRLGGPSSPESSSELAGSNPLPPTTTPSE
ncbi:hypothetical protein ABTY61_23105 [Kitasatospora sp. NPDC096128]|uniref:hypothetical protein n=1 Tax=Kitasatospora sp. NPDC096128 TaxID=3155547 RepID=UPI00331E8F95